MILFWPFSDMLWWYQCALLACNIRLVGYWMMWRFRLVWVQYGQEF